MILAFGLWDIFKVPFGYVMQWLYSLTSSYGLALILFSLVLKLVLFPASAKSKKSMMKMARISPQVKLLELKYGDDKEGLLKAQQQLYKDEGVSMTGGCLWSFLPLIIIIPLYAIIRQPIQYLMHLSSEQAALVVQTVKTAAPSLFAHTQDYYAQLIAARHVSEFAPQIQAAIPDLGRALSDINFNFLGIDLASVPNFRFWAFESWDWPTVGLFLIPIFAAVSQLLAMLISQKMNNQVATNDKGERDKSAASAAQASKTMMYFMPLISLWVCFIMPAAIAIYWIAQSLFGIVQDFVLTLHYRKVYDAEDKIKQERAAQQALIEAEKERIRAQRRAQNPDGITENTSKKKLQQAQKQKAEAAAKEYAQKKAAAAGTPTQDTPVNESAVADRPYARGRAYQRDRYEGKGDEK